LDFGWDVPLDVILDTLALFSPQVKHLRLAVKQMSTTLYKEGIEPDDLALITKAIAAMGIRLETLEVYFEMLNEPDKFDDPSVEVPNPYEFFTFLGRPMWSEFVILSQQVPTLWHIALRGYTSIGITPPAAIRHCHLVTSSLRSLDLSHMGESSFMGLDDKALISIVAQCPLLEFLDIDYNYNIDLMTDKGLLVISEGLSRLKAIFIQGQEVTIAAYQKLFSMHPDLLAFGASLTRNVSAIITELTRLKKIQSIRLGLRQTGSNDEGPPTETFQVAPGITDPSDTCFTSVHTLSLWFELNGGLVKDFARHCPNLQWISVLYSPIGDKEMADVIDSCPRLSVVLVQGCESLSGHRWFEKIREKREGLQYLLCDNCNPNVDKEGLQNIADSCPKAIVVGGGDLINPVEGLGRDSIDDTNFLFDVAKTNLRALEQNKVAVPDLKAAFIGEAEWLRHRIYQSKEIRVGRIAYFP
jgi:hypothetical protein